MFEEFATKVLGGRQFDIFFINNSLMIFDNFSSNFQNFLERQLFLK